MLRTSDGGCGWDMVVVIESGEIRCRGRWDKEGERRGKELVGGGMLDGAEGRGKKDDGGEIWR